MFFIVILKYISKTKVSAAVAVFNLFLVSFPPQVDLGSPIGGGHGIGGAPSESGGGVAFGWKNLSDGRQI